MVTITKILIVLKIPSLIIISCSTETIEPINFSPSIVQNQDSVSIIAQIAIEWDITHTVIKYGLKAKDFQLLKPLCNNTNY